MKPETKNEFGQNLKRGNVVQHNGYFYVILKTEKSRGMTVELTDEEHKKKFSRCTFFSRSHFELVQPKSILASYGDKIADEVILPIYYIGKKTNKRAFLKKKRKELKQNHTRKELLLCLTATRKNQKG